MPIKFIHFHSPLSRYSIISSRLPPPLTLHSLFLLILNIFPHPSDNVTSPEITAPQVFTFAFQGSRESNMDSYFFKLKKN